MARKIRAIVVPKGNIEKMCKAYNCSQASVYYALRYESDSERAQLLRRAAVELYGGIKTSKVIP